MYGDTGHLEHKVGNRDYIRRNRSPAQVVRAKGSVRERLESAAERMARATREDCIRAILRQMLRALLSAERDLKHRQVLADPSYQRERLATLDSHFFERVSAACTSDLIWLLSNWDHELDLQ